MVIRGAPMRSSRQLRRRCGNPHSQKLRQGHDPAMSKAAIYQDAPQTKVRNVSNFVQPDSQAAAKIADRWSRWPLPPIVKVVTRSFRNGMNEASDLANWPDRPHMRSSSTDNATHGAGKE